ncbi:hypothetical protein [Lutispora saccharofermentans]|uniref:Uncharacterized protein n=1 Tax=Lutispora saccharofermentans TaxID=3024236 RepID=A0ABT1ND91_9FIRM|nr:hypothetical protein [Lutispora saccharofermentans]MCQ1529222.1 hypothetical protein [Lutispora saccharofermentans]
MQNNMEGILKDLVYIDNIASDVNKKRQAELAGIEEKCAAEIENLDRQLDEEKAAMRKQLEQAVLKAEEDAKDIEKRSHDSIEALERKYAQIKQEILKQAINKLFDMEMD